MVRTDRFLSAWESSEYLEWRFAEYPQFREFMDLWGNHSGEVVLDYGCGPGNDTTGFAIYSGAQRVIGVDVSARALEVARDRLARHRVDPTRVSLIRVGEAEPSIPLDTASVDYVHSAGVIHHTTSPDAVLAELARVLRVGGTARIMVYNGDSVWRHMYVVWTRMVNGDLSELTPREAFRVCADCGAPESRYYEHHEFEAMCRAAGFEASYLGGYPSLHGELDVTMSEIETARQDDRLPAESREFLERLTIDSSGYPMVDGYLAGLGGCYRLTRV